MSKSTNVIHTFLRQLLPFQRYNFFFNFYLQRVGQVGQVGQDHGVQFSQLHHSIANVKSTNVIFIFLIFAKV